MIQTLYNIFQRILLTMVFSLVIGLHTICATQYAITPETIYPSSYAALESLLPSDIRTTIYSNGQTQFDRLFLSVQLNDAMATAFGLTAGEPYIFVFDANNNQQLDATAGREQWYIFNGFFSLNSKTIYSSGWLNRDKTYYYSYNNYTGGVAAFGLPFISPAGVRPDNVYLILTHKLPADYLSDLYLYLPPTSIKGTMDMLYTSMRFTATEASYFSALGFTLPADEDIIFSFSRVTCSDGYDYYVPTDFQPASSYNFVLKNINNRKLWFTGSVENAYAGDKDASEGFFYLQGTDRQKVDIYLHDYQVKSVQSKTLNEIDINAFLNGCPKGMAAPFAIGTSGEQTGDDIFTVNFHIKGDNYLAGGAKSTSSSSNPVFKILAEIVSITATPIAIRPIGSSAAEVEYRSCCLNFDDHFPAISGIQATNGKLSLPVSTNRDAPSIDLGTRFGRCTFNGGQYQLTTAGNNSMFYVASMAICYRLFEMMGTKNFGVGTSVATPDENSGEHPTVRILNGTFSTYSAEEFKNVVDVVAHGWYRNYTDLRLPIKTRIEGGTFNNCQVYACDASAEQGKAPVNTDQEVLCRTQMEVAAPNEQGLAVLDLSTTNPTYGTASLTPVSDNGKYYVYLYLPGDCAERTNTYTHNYVSVIPLMGANGLLTMGGDVTVEITEPDGTPRKNAFFFYTRLNDYTKRNASVTLAGFTPTVGTAISMAGNHEFSEVKNTDPYTIAHGLYTMLSFNSNQWYTICPPYDVHNVYVVETLPDDSLSAKGLTPADKGTDKYLKKQGEADGVLAQGIVTSLIPDILSGKGSGVYMDLIEICQNTLKLAPILLTHYNPAIAGHSATDANYYLYEQIEDEGNELDGILNNCLMWKVEDNINDYSRKWQYVNSVASTSAYIDKDGNTRSATDIIMQKGKNYSLFLPAGKDNYWTGKYLIFEGYGPQKLDGKNAITGFITSESEVFTDEWMEKPDSVMYMQGNSTFANDTTTNETGRVFVPDTESQTHDFVRKDIGHIVMPWETMLVMSSTNTANYSSLSSFSASTLQAVVARNTSLPTILSNSLLAVNHNGILLQASMSQGVSVYSIDGMLLWRGDIAQDQTMQIAVPAGVYIVQGEWQTIKLIVTK